MQSFHTKFRPNFSPIDCRWLINTPLHAISFLVTPIFSQWLILKKNRLTAFLWWYNQFKVGRIGGQLKKVKKYRAQTSVTRLKHCNWKRNLRWVESLSINKWGDSEADRWGGGIKVSLDKHFVFCWRSEGAIQRIHRQINRLICSGFSVFIRHVLVPWEVDRRTYKRNEGMKRMEEGWREQMKANN